VNFNNQYLGKSVTDKIEVGPSRPEEEVIGVDAISGATVTVIAQNQVMMLRAPPWRARSASSRPRCAIPRATRPASADWASWSKWARCSDCSSSPNRWGWSATPNRSSSCGLAISTTPTSAQPAGRRRLGQPALALKEEQAARSSSSAREGPSRSRARALCAAASTTACRSSRARTFTFRDLDSYNLYGLEAAGAPRYTESAIFIIRSQSFSAAYPWKLSLPGQPRGPRHRHRSFAVFDIASTGCPLPCWKAAGPRWTSPTRLGARLEVRAVEIALFALLLVAVTVVYAYREKLTRLSTHKNKWPVNGFKYSFWAISMAWSALA
jgi:NosR/NirI family nitrous oxide reductase transcriptional regulator